MAHDRISPGEIPDDPQGTVRFYDADDFQYTIQRDRTQWVLTRFSRRGAATLATIEKTDSGWRGVEADGFDQWEGDTLARLVAQII